MPGGSRVSTLSFTNTQDDSQTKGICKRRLNPCIEFRQGVWHYHFDKIEKVGGIFINS